MQRAAHEQGLSERRSSSSPFDNSGIALDRLPGLTYALEAACADLPAALRPLLGEGVRAALEEIGTSTLFETIGDSLGCPGAILRCEEFDARLLIILESRAADFVLASTF